MTENNNKNNIKNNNKNNSKKEKETKLTDHFTLEELTITDVAELKELNAKKADKDKLKILADFAEQVRSVLGCPMTITSGYRCPELNAKIGGSKTSEHTYYEAIDFIPMNMSAHEAFMRIVLSDIKYDQIILEKRKISHLVHISIGNKCQKLYSPAGGKYEKIF